MTDLIRLAIPGFLLLVAIEAAFAAYTGRRVYELKDTAASLTMGLGNVFTGLVAKAGQFAIFSAVHRYAPVDLGYAWWVWVLAFFADDFSYYWFHRTSHSCRLFWASHVVHHSSQNYNLGTALRQTWTGGFYGFLFWLWMPLAGFRPAMVLTMQAISLLYQFWIHTEMVRTLGVAEAVMNTPSHHRVHHASNGRYLDRNHAGILIIWDRLFGTFEPERKDDRPVYGLTTNLTTYNPLRIAFHEWQDMFGDFAQAETWRERLNYIFRSPAWRYEHTKAAALVSSGEEAVTAASISQQPSN